MKRKNLGKRQGGIFQRLGKWIAGEKPPTTEEGYIEHNHNIAQWGPKFDKTPLGGDKYVNGKCCRTVGEYKAALKANDTDLGGWSG